LYLAEKLQRKEKGNRRPYCNKTFQNLTISNHWSHINENTQQKYKPSTACTRKLPKHKKQTFLHKQPSQTDCFRSLGKNVINASNINTDNSN